MTRLAHAVPICGPKVFQSLVIEVHTPIWSVLFNMLPLLELMRATGFEFATTEYQPNPEKHEKGQRLKSSSSVFEVGRHCGNLQFVLEKALSLARRAREEHWSAEKLETVFTEYVALRRKDRGKKERIVVEGKVL